jgi:adhesin HecA-like repeat protein
VFEIAQGAHVTISGLTIQDGNGKTGAFDPSPLDNFGGGILNEGTLTLSGCTVTHNTATGSVAGDGGGIANFGRMTMTGCTVAVNKADDLGGGVYNTGLLTITNSTVANNTVVYGSGNDSDLFNAGTLDVSASTIGHKRYK